MKQEYIRVNFKFPHHMSREVFKIFKTGHANFSDPKSSSQSLIGQGVLAKSFAFLTFYTTKAFAEFLVVERMMLSCHAYVVESSQVSTKNP